jgi:hypothetical protein
LRRELWLRKTRSKSSWKRTSGSMKRRNREKITLKRSEGRKLLMINKRILRGYLEIRLKRRI